MTPETKNKIIRHITVALIAASTTMFVIEINRKLDHCAVNIVDNNTIEIKGSMCNYRVTFTDYVLNRGNQQQDK